MSDFTDCLTLEDVAAFAAGHRRGAERERVIGHLASCADCRELLAASLQIADDLDVAEGRVKIAAFPAPAVPQRRFAWAGRVASVAATIAVVGFVVSQLSARRSPPTPSEWLAEMPAATELAPHVWSAAAMRGPGEVGEWTPQSTELGARLVDCEVALGAADREAAAGVLDRIATILETAGLMDTDAAALRRAAAEPEAADMRAAVDRLMPGLRKRLRERFDPAYLDLGTFAEEVQIAARVGDREFVASRPAQRYVDWLLARPEGRLSKDGEPLPDGVRRALLVLQREGASPEELAGAARTILDTLAV